MLFKPGLPGHGHELHVLRGPGPDAEPDASAHHGPDDGCSVALFRACL